MTALLVSAAVAPTDPVLSAPIDVPNSSLRNGDVHHPTCYDPAA